MVTVAAGVLGLRLLVVGVVLQAAPPEVVAAVTVHGNHISTDEDVVKMAGITVGQPFTPELITQITERLKRAGKFENVTVLKRFASIADPTQIMVVIIVDEGPVRIELPDVPGAPAQAVKRRGIRNLMYLPILSGEDGYGLTYGVQVAWPGVVGQRSRLSFPLTLGGTKQAAAELDRTFVSGPLTRIEVGAGIQQQHNPGYDTDDTRRQLSGRVERALGPIRLAADGAWEHVSFLSLEDNVRSFGGEVALDTRRDPVLPRNAIYALASVSRVYVDPNPAPNAGTTRAHLEGHGYLGLIGQMILVVRVVRDSASQPLPPYLKTLLGGNSNLRGFAAGSFVGDTVVSGTAEIRMPLTSPLDIGKLGISIFADTGKAYPFGARFSDQPYHTGVGASVWIAATAFRVSLAVAHGLGASTRVNFGVGLTF